MTDRRQILRAFVAVTGVGLTTGLAGCMGNESLGETQEALDQMGQNLEEAGQKFEELQRHLDNEAWERCLGNVDPIRGEPLWNSPYRNACFVRCQRELVDGLTTGCIAANLNK